MKMFYTKTNKIVEVFSIYKNKTAMIYHNCSWELIKLSSLIPLTKNMKLLNFSDDVKNRIKFNEAKWVASDGTEFLKLDDALEYEKHLFGKEIIKKD